MIKLLFLGNLGAGEIVIIALVILLLFGGKKIPELMKGLGKGVKSFKDGMNEVEKQIENNPTNTSATPPAASNAPATPSAAPQNSNSAPAPETQKQ